LAKAYSTGLGIKRDPLQALYWYKFAADKDNLNAIKVMENAYRIGERSGLPVKVDLKQAEYWKAKKIPLEKARLKKKREKTQGILKEIYERNRAREKEIQEALKARESR
jgi:TPR repeat protein